MLKIDEVKTVTIRDDNGRAINAGDSVIFVDSSDRDVLAKFVGFDKGIVTFARIMDKSETYGVRAKSIKSIVVVNGVDSLLNGEGKPEVEQPEE